MKGLCLLDGSFGQVQVNRFQASQTVFEGV
jgi:hypothetical protein